MNVLLIDIDHFKRINDSFGHAAGDAVLKAVAGALGAHLRAHDFVARVGGEEFLVGCADAPQEHAVQLAQRLNESVARLQVKTPHLAELVTCTVSVGVSLHCRSQAEWQRIAQQADQALYQAKAAGRNLVHSFTPSIAA
jgi:diguanylate cyclase (GGDEF)-like protein